MKPALAFVALLTLSSCTILQSSYDSHARQECRDLPTTEERLNCERAVTDRAREKRAEDLSEK